MLYQKETFLLLIVIRFAFKFRAKLIFTKTEDRRIWRALQVCIPPRINLIFFLSSPSSHLPFAIKRIEFI